MHQRLHGSTDARKEGAHPVQPLPVESRLQAALQRNQCCILTMSLFLCRIFSDLDCVGGKDSVTVQPGQTGTYTLHVVAPRPGMIQGSVTFMAESGE